MTAVRKPVEARPEFTTANAIDCTLIYRGSKIYQTCKTEAGAKALADLLNRTVRIVAEHGADIVGAPRHKDTVASWAGQVVAAALARSFDWRLELPGDRQRRLADEAEDERASVPHQGGGE